MMQTCAWKLDRTPRTLLDVRNRVQIDGETKKEKLTEQERVSVLGEQMYQTLDVKHAPPRPRRRGDRRT